MTESAVLSPEWVACCDRVDEVWVPTPFHVALFTEAGVAASRVMEISSNIFKEQKSH